MGITRNYKNFLSLFISDIAGGTADFSNASIACMKDYFGNLRSMTQGTQSFAGGSGGGSYSFVQTPPLRPTYVPTSISKSVDRDLAKALCFGTGTANESIEDYALGNIVFTISVVGNIKYTASVLDDGSVKTTVYGVFKSSEDVTINEIGIVHYRALCTSTNNSGSSYTTTYPFLMWRKKLDTPISFVAETPVSVSFDIIMPNLVPSY